MARTIEDLVIQLKADATQLDRELKRADGTVRSSAASMRRSFQDAGTGLTALRTGLAAIGAGAAIGGLVKIGREVREALAFGGELDDASKKIGVAVESLQELRFAAQDFGVEAGSLDTALTRLSKKIGDAAAGNEKATKLFETLGISVKDAAGAIRPTEDILGDIADRIASIEDPATRVKAAMELFGKSGAQLVPLLSQGSQAIREMREEAQATGAVLDEELIAKADLLDDQLTQLSTVIKVQFSEALIAIGPLLVSMARGLAEIAMKAADAANALTALPDLSDGLVDRRLVSVSEQLAQARRDSPGDTGRIQGLEARLQELMNERQRRQNAAVFRNVTGGSSSDTQRRIVFDDSPKGKSGGRGGADKADAERERALERARDLEQQFTTQALRNSDLRIEQSFIENETPMRLLDELEKTGADVSAARVAAERLHAAEIGKLIEEESAKRKKAMQEVAELEQELRARVAQSAGNPFLGIQIDLQRQVEEIDRIAQGNPEKINELRALAAEDAANKIRDVNMQAFQDIADFGERTLGNMLTNFALNGKLAGEDIKNSILQSLVQLGSEAVARGVFNFIGDALGGGGGGGAGGVLGFVGSLFGIAAHAEGGIVTRPHIGLVGEKGPEAIIPLDRMRSLGGGLTVNINNSVPGAEVRARRTASGTLDIEIERSMRRTVSRGSSRDLFGGKHVPGAA